MTFDAGVMPVVLQQCEQLDLTAKEIQDLWERTRQYRNFTDDEVTVRCVDEAEIQRLNRRYRNKDKPTNVLTFSYDDAMHDVALCVAILEREAHARDVSLRDWVARLLVHAFLHVTDLDHERSAHEAHQTDTAEAAILDEAGYIFVT